MNEIDIGHINRLSDIQLSKLLHTLIELEAQRYKLQEWDRSVPFNITTGDAGSDGRIEWNGTPESTRWIKNKFTIFQNKATNLPPKKCADEILETPKKGQKSRKLKAQIEKLVISNGSYILFNNKSIVDQGKENRIDSFRQAISKAGHKNSSSIQIFIYDSNSIKDWTNEYIGAVTLVQRFNDITRPLGFIVWDQWEMITRASENEYKTDPTIESNINLIKENIIKEKVLRVTGHSGLGKTRLVLEAFRDSMLKKSLVYYDLQGSVDISELKSYILSHSEKQDGIIVIDNCDVKSHNILTPIVKSMGHLKLITIGLDDSTSIEELKIKIERNDQREVVKDIIKNKIEATHQSSDIEYINNISEGYPWMAIRFCNIVLSKGMSELNKIPINEFIKKLIFGLNDENEIEHDVIQACSVFSSFGFLDDSFKEIINDELKESLKAQMHFIRTRIYDGELTEKKFNTICNKFRNEDILEKRGIYYIVKPTVLAINLASDWLLNTDSDEVIEIIHELKSVNLEEQFVARLKDLDQIDKAKDIVAELWGPNSPFGTAEVLNTSWGSLLFRYVVEVNPTATAKALEVAFENSPKEEILKIIEGRRNLVWALEKLCFRKESFNIAAKILFSFAVSENETWGNNSTNQFNQLFQLFLSGTVANLSERLKIIKWGLDKADVDYTRIAINALGRGLINDRYTRMGGADKQGSSPPIKDYQPTWKEISDYWSDSINLLTEIACSDDPNSALAQEKLANSIRTLLRDNHIEIVNSIYQIIAAKGELWPDALNNLKFTLNFEKGLSNEIVDQVKNLISILTPSDIKNQLYLTVTKPEWDSYDKDDQGHFIDKPKLNAQKLAVKIIDENIPWQQYIPDLLVGEQRQAVNFGMTLGQLSTNVDELIWLIIGYLKELEKEKQNPELLGGIIAGAKGKINTSDFLEIIINDEFLRHHAFYLARVLGSSYQEIIKLFVLVDKFNLPVTNFQNFQYGRALDELNNEEVIELCDRISNYGNAGKWTALSLLFMYCYGSKEKLKNSLPFLKDLISNTNLIINNDNTFRPEAHHWSSIITKILDKGDEIDFASSISSQIVEFCGEKDLNYSFDSYISNVIRSLFEKYFSVVWEFFGVGIIGDYLTFFHLKNFIGSKNDYQKSEVGIAFENPANYQEILTWCRNNSTIAPERIAEIIPIGDKIGEKETWHPFTKQIIDEFGDNKKVLISLSSNMGTFGGWGSSIPYYNSQKKLLMELSDHKHESVRKWVSDMLDYTERAIKREQLNDEQLDL